MTKIRCIKQGNLPPQLPILSTAVVWLLVDRYNVPGFWRGVIWSVVALWWLIVVVGVFVYEPVDVLVERKIERGDMFTGEPSPEAQRFITRAVHEAKRRGMTA